MGPGETGASGTYVFGEIIHDLEFKAMLVRVSLTVVSDSFRPHGLYPPRLLCPWDFPGKNTGVGHHFLLHGIFPTQGSNLHLLLWQAGS